MVSECQYCYDTGVVKNHPLDSRYDGTICMNCDAGEARRLRDPNEEDES